MNNKKEGKMTRFEITHITAVYQETTVYVDVNEEQAKLLKDGDKETMTELLDAQVEDDRETTEITGSVDSWDSEIYAKEEK